MIPHTSLNAVPSALDEMKDEKAIKDVVCGRLPCRLRLRWVGGSLHLRICAIGLVGSGGFY